MREALKPLKTIQGALNGNGDDEFLHVMCARKALGRGMRGDRHSGFGKSR